MLDMHIASEMTQKRCNSGYLWGMGLQAWLQSLCAVQAQEEPHS